MTTKTYPIGVALSAASGKMLCDFADLHDAMTDLAGWPVYTHHMANQALFDGTSAKLLAQVPWMPGAIENMPDWSGLPRDEVMPAIHAWLARIAEVVGDTVTIELGEPLPFMGAFDGLERFISQRCPSNDTGHRVA